MDKDKLAADTRRSAQTYFLTHFSPKHFDPWIRKGRKRTRYMLGYTVAGRYLFVVYVLQGKGIARVITSMDMDDKTKKLYKKRVERGKQ